MGLLDFLSPALTAATQGVGAYQQGEQAGNAQNATKTMQMIALMRQQHEDAIANQLHQAQIGHLNAQANALSQPKPADYQIVVDPVDGTVRRINKGTNTAEDTTVGGSQGPTSPVPTGTPGGPNAPQSVQPAPKTLTLGVKPTAPLPGTPAWDAVIRRQAQIQHSYDTGSGTVLPGADGKPPQLVMTSGPRVGQTIAVPDVAKPVGGSGGSMSITPQDRAKMLAQMQLDAQTMKQIEDNWAANGTAPGAGVGALGAMSELKGGFRGMLAPYGNKAVGALDPNYQKYLTAQKSFGRLAGNLQSKRYSDFQAELEKTISGTPGADLPSTIAYKQQLRAATLNDPSVIAPTRGAGGSKTMTQAEYNQLSPALQAAAKTSGYMITP